MSARGSGTRRSVSSTVRASPQAASDAAPPRAAGPAIRGCRPRQNRGPRAPRCPAQMPSLPASATCCRTCRRGCCRGCAAGWPSATFPAAASTLPSRRQLSAHVPAPAAATALHRLCSASGQPAFPTRPRALQTLTTVPVRPRRPHPGWVRVLHRPSLQNHRTSQSARFRLVLRELCCRARYKNGAGSAAVFLSTRWCCCREPRGAFSVF